MDSDIYLVGQMTPERAAELATRIRADYAISMGAKEAIQQAILAACKEERADVLKGEFICARCGLRKDSEHGATHEF